MLAAFWFLNMIYPFYQNNPTNLPEAYLEPCQATKVKLSVNVVIPF